MIDIDDFKAYNDHYGHVAGDDCLRRVCSALRDAARRRPLDFVARYGGEELVAVLYGADRSYGESISRSLLSAVRELRIPHASSPTQRFPVIYLLHGSPGTMNNWFGGAHADTTTNDLITTEKIGEVILVAPDGNGPVYKFSEWANSRDGRQRMEDAIAHDLVAFIDGHYRTIASPAGRTLAGLSDGGFGAANIALHHPDVFGSVLTLGGFYRADKSLVFGTGPLDDTTHHYNSPAVYITTAEGLAAAHLIHFIVGVATHDRGYYTAGMAFYEELKRLDTHVDLISVSGDHSWRTWGMQFAEALPLLEPLRITVSRPPGH